MPKGPKQPPPANPNPDWQDRDINLKAVAVSLAIIAAVTVFAFLAMDALFDAYKRREALREAPISPLAQVRDLPPAPRLQVFPLNELAAHHETVNQLLENYQWIDPETGIARIPIERAMAVLAERGLPARASGGGGSE